MSYVRSHGTRDLNDYDQFFGNFRNPIIRPNENSLSPTDVPQPADRPRHDRAAGPVGVLAALRVAHRLPVVGGERVPGLRRRAQSSRAGCRPCRRSTSRWRGRGDFRKYRFTAGIKIYNAFDSGNERDVQNNIAVAGLRQVLQSDSAVDRIRLRHDPAVIGPQ